ncbi:MAG: hypothetical protein ACREAK_10020, partial [Nitrosarchaeum sp.]
MTETKDVVAGLGEIGNPIFQLISSIFPVIGYDIDPKLIPKKNFTKYSKLDTRFLHICIPFAKNFHSNVLELNKKFEPKGIVIHSTISPNTTSILQKELSIPVIYSATRGIHKRMLSDLKRYTKFYSVEPDASHASWASSTYSKLM